MAGRNTSGAIDPVIIRTFGLPVVPDKRFVQPISAFEFIGTRVLVMSGSSRAPNIFLVRFSRNNALRPTYDRDVRAPPNEMIDHCCQHDGPLVTSFPFSVFQYLEQYLA